MRIISKFINDECGSARRDIASLLLFFGIAFFQFLGRIPLIDPDEGRYAEIPREMLERGDFITPFFNYVHYFEKPPLHYWLNAISMSLFGQNEFAARFPGALMGLLTVLLTYHVGRTLFDRRAGLLAALILGTSTGFLVQSRLDITDITLTCTLSASLAFFIMAVQEAERRKRLYYYLFHVCAALAVLAKGLIGMVFPIVIIFSYLLITRRWGLLKEMRLATGIPLFLLVAAPWFIAVSLRNPEFARFFFIHEHFERFTTKVHGRYEPPWFFIPVLVGTMFPWSFFIPTSVRRVWQERQSADGGVRLYLLIWALFIFLFFSISDSKLIPYILPVFPPLALLMGRTFAKAFSGDFRPLKVTGRLLGWGLVIVGVGISLYPHLAHQPEIGAIAGLSIGLLLLGEGIAGLVNSHRQDALALFTGFCIFSYIIGVVGPPFILTEIAEKKSLKQLGLIVREQARPDDMVASFGLQQGLSFYAKRRVVVVGDRNELDFGSRQGDQSAWFIDSNGFVSLWNSQVTVFASLRETELTPLAGMLRAPVRTVGRQGKRILITNR
ncbi:MAG: phospholipid carrier-dependent glycosyltransferase [Geobacteraceae bacterium]